MNAKISLQAGKFGRCQKVIFFAIQSNRERIIDPLTPDQWRGSSDFPTTVSRQSAASVMAVKVAGD